MALALPSILSVRTLGRLLLLLVLVGAAGLLAELALMEHWGEWRQTIAVGLLAVTLPVTVAFERSPAGRMRSLFLLVMTLVLVAGIVGTLFHLQGNFAFEQELSPDLPPLKTLLKSLQGATPTLAPGAMIQLGLLGWIAAATMTSRPS
jgi:hypothetical protein